MPPRRRISAVAGTAALAAVREGIAAWDGQPATPVTWDAATFTAFAAQLRTVAPNQLATAVRYLLEELATTAPGNSVEVRVPPFGVTQCLPGPHHKRGTPPNVVELSPSAWLALALGLTEWETAQQAGAVLASGVRADLAPVLPILSPQ